MSEQSKRLPRRFFPASDPLSEFALAIGWLCIAWRRLEIGVDYLLYALLGVDTETSTLIGASIELRAKIQIVKALAFKKRWSDKWYNSLEMDLDEIDNDLRVQRNRFVHDLLVPDGDEIKRHQRKVGINKRQSRMPLELSLAESTTVTADDIWKLADRTQLCMVRLIILADGYTRRTADQPKDHVTH